MFYTLKNENGNLLKYVFKDRIVFNGEPGARSIVVYRCKKKDSAEKLKSKCETIYGHKNLEIVEFSEDDISSIPKPEAPTKESRVKYLNKPTTKQELDSYYNKEEDETYDPDYLWTDINEKCKGCGRGCKQSFRATIIRCPQYQPC